MDEVTTCALCHLASQNRIIQLILLVSCLFNSYWAMGDNLDQPDNHQFCQNPICVHHDILLEHTVLVACTDNCWLKNVL